MEKVLKHIFIAIKGSPMQSVIRGLGCWLLYVTERILYLGAAFWVCSLCGLKGTPSWQGCLV